MDTIATIGREIYPGSSFGIRTSDNSEVLQDAAEQDIYQVTMVTEGSIVLTDGTEHSALLPPQVLCLSYKNPMKHLELTGAKGFSIFFIPQVINHGLFSDSSCKADMTEENLSHDAFLAERLLIKPFRQGEISNPFHISVNPTLQGRLTDLYTGLRDQFTLQPNNFWPCRGRSYFLEILMLLQSLYAFEGDSDLDIPLPRGNPVVEEAARTMLLRYSETNLKLSSIAGRSGFLTFSSAFRRSAGLSPAEYLRKIRLTVASNLLRNTILPSQDISQRSGYARLRVFEKDFKKQFKKGPAEYRAQFPNPYG